MARPQTFFGPTRFIGGLIPLDLFEALEAVRGELGIPDRSEAIRRAILLFVEQNPTSGRDRIIQELVVATDKSQAARHAVSSAIAEWRLSRAASLLKQIAEAAEAAGISLPRDVQEAIEEARNAGTI